MKNKLKKFMRDEVILTADDLAKQLLRCVPKEWHTPHKKLVEDDSHGPPVYWFPIALSQDHFWSYILRCATYL